MRRAVYIEDDGTVNVILYHKEKPVRKVIVYPDGKVAFRDYGDAKADVTWALIKPIRRDENGKYEKI